VNDSILSVYWNNFISFDFLIFILAAVNVYFLVHSLRQSQSIAAILYPKGYLPGGWESYGDMKQHYDEVMNLKGEQTLIEHRRRMNLSYTIFENITTIFPLLGILGTVISLIPMVQSIGTIEQSLFFSALTSTFWGIVFAIIFKGINGYLEAGIGEAEKNIQIFLDRYSTMVKQP
jgi:chemotaxis protein MotA